jgi:hypothetical protein
VLLRYFLEKGGVLEVKEQEREGLSAGRTVLTEGANAKFSIEGTFSCCVVFNKLDMFR